MINCAKNFTRRILMIRRNYSFIHDNTIRSIWILIIDNINIKYYLFIIIKIFYIYNSDFFYEYQNLYL